MLFFCRPGKDSVLRVVTHDQFADTVVIDIAQPNAAVAIFVAREDRLAVEFQAAQERAVLDPVLALESPGTGNGLVAQQHDRQAIRRDDSEAHSGIDTISSLIQYDEGGGKGGFDPFILFWVPDSDFARI